MSSHHIVREKQEPALLALGVDTFSEELLGQLLEWNPTVIVTADTAEKVHAFGIKIDWLISDNIIPGMQSDIKLMPQGSDTAASAALKYLVSNNYPAVNIVTDDFELKDFLLFAGKINMVIFERDKKIYPVSSGFSKWKPAGERITLLTHPRELAVSGIELIEDHVFKTTHDGFYSLQFSEPFLFIAEDL